MNKKVSYIYGFYSLLLLFGIVHRQTVFPAAEESSSVPDRSCLMQGGKTQCTVMKKTPQDNCGAGKSFGTEGLICPDGPGFEQRFGRR